MDSFPKCQVCHQYFTLKSPAPFLLPCLHSVCETCVKSTGDGVISCSTCEEEVHLAETHLQKDVVRQREIFHLTVKHCHLELLCTHEDDGNQAMCWCQKCEEFLCEYCHNLHESFKATRKHVVKDIGDIEAGKLNHEEPCSIHPKCLVDFWDNDCNILICCRCRLGEHIEHDIMDVDVAAESAGEEIRLYELEIQSITDRHNLYEEKTTEHMKRTDETSDNLRESIRHTFQVLRSILDQREKELDFELDQKINAIKLHLNSKRKEFQTGLMRGTLATEYIKKALLYSSNHDLLDLKRKIGSTAQACRDSGPPEKEEDLILPVLLAEGLDRMKSTLVSFGNIAESEDLPTTIISQEDKSTQTEEDYLSQQKEIEDQQKHLGRLETELSTFKLHNDTLRVVLEELTTEKKTEQQNVHDARREIEKLLQDKKDLENDLSRGKIILQSLETSVSDYKRLVATLPPTVSKLCLMSDKSSHFLVNESHILQCVHLRFDRDRVNVNKVHISAEGELVNKPDPGPSDHSRDRLVRYEGTTSNALFSQCGSPQYWEVKTRVGIDETLTYNALLLEIGVCVEEERDQQHCIGRRHHSCALTVTDCPTHNSICGAIWKDGNHVLCLPDALPNTPGQSVTLHYGVVFDDIRCRVIFIDITTDKVMSVVKGIDCSRPVWPMFGVYNPDWASVKMSLVVGGDIDMTEEKKAMILKSLSQQ